jgi:hypothetical protein
VKTGLQFWLIHQPNIAALKGKGKGKKGDRYFMFLAKKET